MSTNQSKTYHCAYLYLLTGKPCVTFQEDRPLEFMLSTSGVSTAGLHVVDLGCHHHSIMDHDRKLGIAIPDLDRDRQLGMVIPGLDRD